MTHSEPDPDQHWVAEYWYQSGMKCLQCDESSDKEAEDYFASALEADPAHAGALIMKMSFGIQHKHFEETLALCDRLMDLEPAALGLFNRTMIASIWRNKALALHGLGRIEEEIAFYEQTLASHPPAAEQAEIWGLKGAALMACGKCTEALICFQTAQDLGNPRAAQLFEALRAHAQSN